MSRNLYSNIYNHDLMSGGLSGGFHASGYNKMKAKQAAQSTEEHLSSLLHGVEQQNTFTENERRVLLLTTHSERQWHEDKFMFLRSNHAKTKLIRFLEEEISFCTNEHITVVVNENRMKFIVQVLQRWQQSKNYNNNSEILVNLYVTRLSSVLVKIKKTSGDSKETKKINKSRSY